MKIQKEKLIDTLKKIDENVFCKFGFTKDYCIRTIHYNKYSKYFLFKISLLLKIALKNNLS